MEPVARPKDIRRREEFADMMSCKIKKQDEVFRLKVRQTGAIIAGIGMEISRSSGGTITMECPERTLIRDMIMDKVIRTFTNGSTG